LTDEYPAITKRKHLSFLIFFYDVDMASVIPGRPNAEKSETTMAAVAQILAVFNLDGLGPPNGLVFSASQQKGGRDLEVAAMEIFEKEVSKILTPEVIENLGHVWFILIETIEYASTIGAQVYGKNFYGPPHSIPWIEFIGIAVVVAKHYQLFSLKYDTDIYL
jgi:hypothetical protein